MKCTTSTLLAFPPTPSSSVPRIDRKTIKGLNPGSRFQVRLRQRGNQTLSSDSSGPPSRRDTGAPDPTEGRSDAANQTVHIRGRDGPAAVVEGLKRVYVLRRAGAATRPLRTTPRVNTYSLCTSSDRVVCPCIPVAGPSRLTPLHRKCRGVISGYEGKDRWGWTDGDGTGIEREPELHAA